MAAATQDRDAQNSDGRIVSYPVASGMKIYAGTLTELNSAGYLTPFVGVSPYANSYVGVAADHANNTSSNTKITVADGAINCRVEKRGCFTFKAQGTPGQTNVGDIAYGLDDQTIGNSAMGAPEVGRFVEATSSTEWRIRIDNSVK